VARRTDNFLPATWSTMHGAAAQPIRIWLHLRFEARPAYLATKQGTVLPLLYPEPPPPGLVPSCEGGVLGILPDLVASSKPRGHPSLSWKGQNRSLAGCCWLTPLNMRFRELKCARIPTARSAAKTPTVTELMIQQFCGWRPETPRRSCEEWNPAAYRQRTQRANRCGEDVQLIDVREPYEYQIAKIGGKLDSADMTCPTPGRDRSSDARVIVHCRSGDARSEHRGVYRAGRIPQGSQSGRRHPCLVLRDRTPPLQKY